MKTSLTLFTLFLFHFGQSQNWELIARVLPGQEITSVSIDSKSMFYVGTVQGSVVRYAMDGEEDNFFSELNNSPVTSIQAWNRLKVFTFFRDQQTIAILDRFTTTPKSIDLKTLNLQYAWLFTPGVDNSYWALSTEFKELIKYDDQNLNVLFKLPLKGSIDLKEAIFLRAYKNLVILVDQKSGIWIFDQYGDLLGQIKETGLQHIQILEDLIHTTNGTDYLVIDPFRLMVKERKKAPVGAFKSVVTSGERYVFFTDKEASIFEYN